MKFIEPRPFADPEVAARKLIELANAFEPVQDGRIYIECCLIPRREYPNETAPAHWGAGGWGRQGSTDRGTSASKNVSINRSTAAHDLVS